MLSKSLAIEILNAALATGGDFAEIYFENTNSKVIQVEGDKVEACGGNTLSGVGIRILKELRSVYGHTNDLSKKSLLNLAESLSKSYSGKRIKTVKDLKQQKFKRINKKIDSYANVKDSSIIKLCKDATEVLSKHDKRIVRSIAGFKYDIQDVVIYNSDEKLFKDHREHARLMISGVAMENGKIETSFEGPGTQEGFEYFTKTLDVKALAKKSAEKLIMMLGARECPAGKFPVIIGNGWGGVIFHEACGHQLEATSVAKGLSVFSGKIGKQIANKCVSAYDNATIKNAWGSNNIDDEGYQCRNNLLIENGILKGYLVDPFGARRMKGFEPNGCSRRQSYKFEPTSRMSNTYIAKGKYTPEEIIKATKLGVYMVTFGGGSVDPSTGDFNFGCSEAYLVKDGKVCEPLRGATLVGKADEILLHIDMVGKDLNPIGCGMCGSVSGSIPVNVGQPTIRVDEITVGGRGGDINEL